MTDEPRLKLVGGTTVRSQGGDPPSGGDGGGMSPDLETRVISLEGKLEKIDVKLESIKELNGKIDGLVKDMSYLRGKVDAMPTTLQLLGFVVAVLAIAGLAKYLSP